MMTETSLIEGIDNQILLLMGTFFMVCVLFLAWSSTRVHRSPVVNNASPSAVPPPVNSHPTASAPLANGSINEAVHTPQEEDGVRQRRVPGVNSEPATIPPPSVDPVDSQTRTPGAINIRIKYLDDRQKSVFAHPSESVVNFKRKHFSAELGRNMNVRLIFNGRELREDRGVNLSQYGLIEDSTVHCLVTQRPAMSEEMAGVSLDADDIDLGGIMFPLFGAILAAVWYCRLAYRQYFSVFSTVALLGISILFVVAGYASWCNRRAAREREDIEIPPVS